MNLHSDEIEKTVNLKLNPTQLQQRQQDLETKIHLNIEIAEHLNSEHRSKENKSYIADQIMNKLKEKKMNLDN